MSPIKSPIYLFASIIFISGVCNGIPKLAKKTENFLLRSEKVTQDEAIYFCRLYSMELVSIEDPVKNAAVFELLKDNDNGYAVWTSAKKDSDQSSWTWVNGKEIEYFNWGPGEPNGARGNEYCIEVVKTNDDVIWNDQPCKDRRAYVCEKPKSGCDIALVNVTVDGKECSMGTETPSRPTKKFYLSTQTASHAQALKQCSEMFMQLAQLRDETENSALYEMMRGKDRDTDGAYWTAGTREAGKDWEWLNGEPITYFNWGKGEPNSKGNVRACLEVFVRDNALIWIDQYCSDERFFVCEKEDPVVTITVNGKLIIPQESGTDNFCKVVVNSV